MEKQNSVKEKTLRFVTRFFTWISETRIFRCVIASLYEGACPSVGWSVHRSVRPSRPRPLFFFPKKQKLNKKLNKSINKYPLSTTMRPHLAVKLTDGHIFWAGLKHFYSQF